MNNFWLIIAEIAGNSWFWQGMIINAAFTLVTMPFTNKIVQKIFRNRKKNRIAYARDELQTFCIQQLLENKNINKDEFENMIYMLAIKYNLDKKDIYNDKIIFLQNLAQSILKIDLLGNNTKEKLSDKIRKDNIFTEPEYETSNNNSTLSDEMDCTNEFYEENIELDRSEKIDIFKYTGIITSIIFIMLLLYTFLSQVLIVAYGNNSIIFINTIIIILAIIPIIVNGIIYFKKFDEYNKVFLGLFILISILNISNFISIIGVLLYQK